jgi:hypothetical protein
VLRVLRGEKTFKCFSEVHVRRASGPVVRHHS